MPIPFVPNGTSDRAPRPENNLLLRLREDDYALIAQHIRISDRVAGEQLYGPGDDVSMVYFPCGASLVSYLVCNEDGRDVESVLVGHEGAIGGIVSLGHLPAYCRMMVKHSGPFGELDVTALERAKLQSHTLRQLFARYADCLLAQIFQSTACNAIHSIEQRAAKWIMAAIERTGDTRVPLTHEQLATMLGVGRSYTSRVLQIFRQEGILETRRGALVVRDVAALGARACRCNEAVKGHFETVLEGLYPAEPPAAVAAL